MRLSAKEEKALYEKAEQCLSLLSELGCDSVVLGLTWVDKDTDTASRVFCSGNYWARIGLMSGWLNREQEKDLADYINKDEEEV